MIAPQNLPAPSALRTSQQKLVKALAAVGAPYDIAFFPTAPTYVAAYDYKWVSLTAFAAILRLKIKAAGHLPVTIRSLSRTAWEPRRPGPVSGPGSRQRGRRRRR